jgi:hypothetical protein
LLEAIGNGWEYFNPGFNIPVHIEKDLGVMGTNRPRHFIGHDLVVLITRHVIHRVHTYLLLFPTLIPLSEVGRTCF